MGLTVETTIEEAQVVNADPHRIQQLFNNLLENMVRYTHAPGSVRIECRSSDDAALIDFHNSCPGVSAEQLDHLFERFYRADSPEKQTSVGAGLGLAICRKIVEAHGGTIVAQRSELGGVLIRVQLPKLGASRPIG
jgi:two-component system, OmpR family, sensor histidine kinase BaeS